MGVYLRAKFEVSSIILTSFTQIPPPPNLPQNKPLKSPPRLWLIGCYRTTLVLVCVQLHKLKVPVNFEEVGRVISRDFVNFCGLELLNFLPQTFCFHEESFV